MPLVAEDFIRKSPLLPDEEKPDNGSSEDEYSDLSSLYATRNQRIGDSGLPDENMSSFTIPPGANPPVRRTSVPPGKILSANYREKSSGPEVNIINLLQEKAQRELRVLPGYSNPMKDDGIFKVICKIEFEGAVLTSVGLDKSKEVAKRKSAEKMMMELGVDNNLLRSSPKHDEIELVSGAKEFFLKHLRNNRNRTLHSAFETCSNEDGRTGLGNNMFYFFNLITIKP